MFARDRCSLIVGYVVHSVTTAFVVGYVSTGVMFDRPGQECYRRALCSHRDVRPCLHPVATAIAEGYVVIGVMFARNRCFTIVGHVYALSLLL